MKRRKKNQLAGIAITAILVYGMFSLISASARLKKVESLNEALESEIAAAQQEQKSITALIENSGSNEQIGALARARLGLVKPGEIIFVD